VAVHLRHEGLAEAHHLAVGAAPGVEVGAALGAADRHARERVLEDLLEAEELDDAEVDGRMEAEAALVGAKRAVELDAEAPVDLHLAGVILPGHAEDDLPLRLADPLDDPMTAVLGELRQHRSERAEHLAHRLMEFRLAGVAPQDILIDGFQTLMQCHMVCYSLIGGIVVVASCRRTSDAMPM
jgi:hypothetical protein